MIYIGTMTGTSVDGLDVALLRVEPSGERQPSLAIVAAATVPLPPDLASTLKTLARPGDDGIDAVAAADAELGAFTGEAILACLADWRVAASDVRAIGTHGQTVRHRPAATRPYTVQIGDPNRIAEATGIDTVADFRRRDVAAGGQGAPLVPLFHEALFHHPQRSRVVVNIGGIANVTVLGRSAQEAAGPLGFDTGPGNALLDAWAQQHRAEPFDDGGRWAAGGQVAANLLARLQQDAFVAAAPPKSTGKETYHLGYVELTCAGQAFAPQDVQATLAEFTAWSIATAIRRWGTQTGDVIVCGGGTRNGDLLRRLGSNLPNHRVITSAALGVDPDGLEAAAFAWFAHRALARLPGNAPAATGAEGPRVLGAIYPGYLRGA